MYFRTADVYAVRFHFQSLLGRSLHIEAPHPGRDYTPIGKKINTIVVTRLEGPLNRVLWRCTGSTGRKKVFRISRNEIVDHFMEQWRPPPWLCPCCLRTKAVGRQLHPEATNCMIAAGITLLLCSGKICAHGTGSSCLRNYEYPTENIQYISGEMMYWIINCLNQYRSESVCFICYDFFVIECIVAYTGTDNYEY